MVGTDKTQTELFDRGVVAHIGLVRHIGAATLSRPADLDDFTRDVLARAFAKRDQLRDLSRLRAWVAAIARNTAQNWNRNQRFTFTELSDALSLPVPLADERLSERERWVALVDALSRLPDSDQALIRAYYVDELSAREIQAHTRLSADAIRARLSRARAVLRQRLAPLLGVVGSWTPREGREGSVKFRRGAIGWE